jgi:hypothetical protein
MRSLPHGFGTREMYEAEDGAAGLEVAPPIGDRNRSWFR